MYAPIIMSLATLATSADPDAVEKIINLMHKIKTALATSLKEDQDSETTEAADWVTEKATIENTIATLNSQIHTLKTDIEKYEARIQESKDIIAAQIKTRD
jgi:peptidoglycan hydrolase CwlO-like protein